MKKNKFQMKREATFERFIDAGLNLLIDRAYDPVSVEDISRAAGYSKGAFYVHFVSKEDFLNLLLEKRQIKKKIIIGYLDQKEQMAVKPLTLDEAAKHAAELLYTYYLNKPSWEIASFAMNMPTYKVLQKCKTYVRLYELWVEENALYIKWLKERKLIDACIDPEYTAKIICAVLDGIIKQSYVLGQPVTFRSFLDALSVFITPEREPAGPRILKSFSESEEHQ
ncbi:TetR/AcrR family transcriptional regulator [Bacillus tequilensis]|uniref:TetR/AcrR family transcriptional regulator n=1 Tax=Bacillus tequilensis TaxID=227866 RepID=UPI000464396D|nr:helix-turn-helix domain-containing protein [Bacillus tequilensis]MDR4433481.1 helix-turn-helix transcriptional regulator [Bacillus tequilensis]SPT95488.1 transcriptional regulator [Bacillus tequilensis]